jgi:TRAP-type C4-dicarboxylate transport system permease small subunit
MKKTLNWLDENLEEFLLVVMLAAMTLIMGIQIFSRYALGQSLSWSEEVTRFLFIWSGFLSVSYCSKKCLSIKIEQFVAAFPRRGKALFKVINHTFELIFFLYMIPFAYSYMMSAIHSGQLSPACGIPMYYIQAAPFVSFLLVTFRILQRWIIEFKIARGEDVYDPAHPERNTPESFIHANADIPETESNEIESLIGTASRGKESSPPNMARIRYLAPTVKDGSKTEGRTEAIPRVIDTGIAMTSSTTKITNKRAAGISVPPFRSAPSI